MLLIRVVSGAAKEMFLKASLGTFASDLTPDLQCVVNNKIKVNKYIGLLRKIRCIVY